MSIQVSEFRHIPGKNDTEYIKLLKEALERQKQITNKAMAKIKELSNCSEIPNNWILCSERMPDEHEWLGTKKFGTTMSDIVYVTFENPKGERFCKHLSFQNKKLSHYDQDTIDVFYKGSKPIAWMPLPAPFQPKEE